jgi:hypothetical protein
MSAHSRDNKVLILDNLTYDSSASLDIACPYFQLSIFFEKVTWPHIVEKHTECGESWGWGSGQHPVDGICTTHPCRTTRTAKQIWVVVAKVPGKPQGSPLLGIHTKVQHINEEHCHLSF